MGKSKEDFGQVVQEREQSPWLQQVMDNYTWMLSDTGQCGWAFLGALCCSALVTSVVELLAAVTAVSSESHCDQAGQVPKAQHGEAPGIIADAGLDSRFSLKDFGVIGNAGLAVACLTLAAWLVFPGTRVC